MGLLLIAAFLLASGAAAHAQSGKVSPAVAKAMAAGSLGKLVVVLNQQADLSGAARLKTKAEKTRFVFETLQATAAKTQPAFISGLSRMGLKPGARLYIENAVVVSAANGRGSIASSAVSSLAARDDVARIGADEPIAIDRKEKTSPAAAPLGITWNVTWVGAPKVWAAGFTGQGVVVGDLDTGVQWDHPALIRQYRGWNGSTADHNYNWWDPSDEHSLVPVDTNGHGTATTGISVGDDGAGNQIGVAPNARWIACRGLGPGASASTLLECLQFMLAPWDLNGNNPDPSKAPDVVNNSYICPFCGLETAFDNLKAAGIFSVGVTGNFGPSCGSVFDPGDYQSILAIGALDFQTNTIADYSSRGPSDPVSNGPELTAPGSDITSAAPGNTYAEGSGTSFAAPGVTGAVALLWSARPQLFGDVDGSAAALEHGATPILTLACGSSFRPNHVYGFGSMNVAAAALGSQ